MKIIALAFAGRMGSGKTTISNAVANLLEWPFVSFGDYVRAVAKNRNLDETREILQELGALLMREDCEQFCRSVISQVNWKPGNPIVIDGVRHAEVIPIIKSIIAPAELRLILLRTDKNVCESRLNSRQRSGDNDLHRAMTHTTEAQVETTLPQIADLIIDSSQDKEKLPKEILKWVQKWSS